MTDQEFLQRFEDCTLASDDFHHEGHVRMAWLYLSRFPVLEAIERFTEGLKRYAASKGKPDLYHETITWAYLLLINERQARGEAATWDEFARANPDLLTWKDGALKRYYRDETLASPLAKAVFVLPDAAPTSCP